MRALLAHQQLFWQNAAVQTAASYGLQNFPDTMRPAMMLQTPGVRVVGDREFTFGDFAVAIGEIAKKYGCPVRETPEHLVNQRVHGEWAYACVHAIALRSIPHLNNKKQLMQLMAPLNDLFDLAEQTAGPSSVAPINPSALVSLYLMHSQSTHRSAGIPTPFDLEAETKIADRTCRKMLKDGIFSEAPLPIQEALYEGLVGLSADKWDKKPVAEAPQP
ncbi:hypothetical protein V0M98_36710 (plasmid) [Pseudomonas silesiensis]|uniref:hypothetical protein n=1 Tax=Pseudomonas silesiensis TaxID=1853130 RepID=UPI0030D56822